MKKVLFTTTAILLSVLLFSSVGHSDISAGFGEGKEMQEKGALMMEKGKMMQQLKLDDKVAMVDEGHKMIKEGTKILHDGMMAESTRAHSGLQEMGQMMMNSGRILLKKGKQKEPLTEKDKKEIQKHGENMISLGQQMIEKGKRMVGN